MKNFSIFISTCALLCILPISLSAQESTTVLKIDQRSPNGIIGEWTLIKPGNKRATLTKLSQTFNEVEEGLYTLMVTPPSGATTIIEKYLEEDLIEQVDHPQLSFEIEAGVHTNIIISYTFVRVGIVSVNSEPAGLKYSLEGPNGYESTGTTPESYQEMPVGMYSATFEPITDCAEPKPISDILEKDSRINFSITLACEGLEDLAVTQIQNTSFKYVQSVIDGNKVVFFDVPISEWYAPYIQTVIKSGVMSGYKDENGNLSGSFGPGNNVTMAELLKVAHELSDIDENAVSGRANNILSKSTWFERYMNSAETLNWLAYQDHRLDPGKNATRSEVIVTLLQALQVPRQWSTGEAFTDIERSTLYSSSVETAALDGLVNGYEDGSFRPNDSINRAEMAKIISQAILLYKN
ncbi:S-layer homology domain-containing protein [Candidatus Peregrinibacteria bacterium]|jgi:hypothetical protein|nr:S-layer homology domain-containing protein [Candidatus Peregrinibacteria bacterium]MBT3598900.1 S-layer homology domain-containing protein [Candidatus Peregrinibacteria bacterium]MBT4367317.1 S-layer homology domain-containing protein [Candidatus Peregrinibacteria bacterium]MBT4585788.1 S-layer homology domain-containing protein [Candidatus Peregrinibacteria bacterium]MBT6730703.1 S-layer homology domain-containing protein [Candidatus Peregrinibacteria bacterium]